MTVIAIVGDKENTNVANYAYKHRGFRDGDLVCQWFDEKNVLQSDIFQFGALKEVTE